MKLHVCLVVAVVLAVSVGCAMYACAQEAPAPIDTAVAPAADIQWLWGEAVNVGGSDLTVKTLDYETDAEKEMKIAVNDKTTFENVKAFTEIKPQDTVAIDYQVMPDASFLAKNISVERPEALPAVPPAAPDAGVPATTPGEIAPAANPAAVTGAEPAAPEAPAQSAADSASSAN